MQAVSKYELCTKPASNSTMAPHRYRNTTVHATSPAEPRRAARTASASVFAAEAAVCVSASVDRAVLGRAGHCQPRRSAAPCRAHLRVARAIPVFYTAIL